MANNKTGNLVVAHAKRKTFWWIIGLFSSGWVLLFAFLVGLLMAVAAIMGMGVGGTSIASALPSYSAAGSVVCGPKANFSNITIEGPMTDEQLAIALRIVNFAKANDELSLDWTRYAELGIADALQESHLHNYLVAVDHDSLGIFQQTHFWGSAEQRVDLDYEIAAFYGTIPGIPGMLQVPGHETLPLKELAINTQNPVPGAARDSAWRVYSQPSNNFEHWDVVAQQILSDVIAGCTQTPFASGNVQAGNGSVKIAAGANNPGQDVTPETMNFLQVVAAIYGNKLVCTTGTNHSYFTVNGLVSDHSSGHACDFGMVGNGGTDDGPVGDGIATACLIAAGVDPVTARQEASAGGLYNIDGVQTSYGPMRIQCIWKTYEGGNHHNHVHIGARPA